MHDFEPVFEQYEEALLTIDLDSQSRINLAICWKISLNGKILVYDLYTSKNFYPEIISRKD